MTTEQFPARGEYVPGSPGHIRRELDEARELLAAIRDDEVNAQDEADKFLRDNRFSALHAALEEVGRLREAVELLYDKWENGEDCHEISGDEMGAFLGKAFRLSKEEEDAILALLKGIPTPSPMQIVTQRAEKAEREVERLKVHAEAMAPVGMLEPLRIIGDRLLAHYGDRFCLTRPTLHTDYERQVLVAALKALRAGLAYRAELKVES